ncbi:RNA polymerase sigma factor [Agrobacterium tumefaciens]|uniref:RNA polymerase sigma factor n=1 Tax=Agrobacterium tumefaciens TaxID=358 RepID=UPI0021D3A4B9|nr:RNA polymerase sigma factor [Agrobacterium tumefaciens]UXS01840.1 RNA polymerase sigma factor [Agrobacterium tumefaciens]HEE4993110.1 RNA polymerase sigma factor [Klebsiella pneumoniae]
MWDLKRLFQKHAQEIDRFLRKRGHQPDVASDLTQDVFLKLLTSSPPKHSENPRAYLHTIARNVSVDLYRREQIVQREDLSEEEYADIADPTPGPDKVVHHRQRLATVDRALSELPEKTRRAFELYRLGDMTISEVADELGLSVSRTWTLIRRAYLHLQASLDDEI